MSNPVPYVDIVSPVSIHPGATLVTLQVYGTGFVATSIVKWNGTSLTTTFVSSKKLTGGSSGFSCCGHRSGIDHGSNSGRPHFQHHLRSRGRTGNEHCVSEHGEFDGEHG